MQPTIDVDAEVHRQAVAELPAPRHLIGSDWVTGSGPAFDHADPATGLRTQSIRAAGPTDVDRAVAAGTRALPAWRALRPAVRGRLLRRFGEALADAREHVARTASAETGLPIAVTSSFAVRGAEFIEYYGGLVDKMEGSVIGVDPGLGFDYVLREPFGVVGLIMTWNGSVSALGRKAGAALAAGNTVIIKSSELAPYSAVVFGELALAAGIPPGVLNVVTGDAVTGDLLVRHPDVRKISFTGGSAAARKIQAAAAAGPKPVAFELGGKSANIVFDDADVEAAAAFSATSAMFMSGQGCALPTRLLAHRSIYPELVERVAHELAQLPIGDPFDPKTTMGPMVSSHHCIRVLQVIRDAESSGSGNIVVGGGVLHNPGLASGNFLEATMIADADPSSSIAQHEVFGPVLVAMPFSDEEEAIRLANGTDFGLAAYVHTESLRRAHRMAPALEAGTVRVNGMGPGSAAAIPFGGTKASGFGREGGRAGFEEFSTWKNVFIYT